MEVTIDPAQILVAVTGLVALLTGLRQKRKSSDRQDRIQSARTELNRREQQRKESLDAHEAKDRLIESLQAQHDRDQADKATTRREFDERVASLREQHERDLVHERAAREAADRICRREIQHMHEELMGAAAIIRSEADASSVRDAAHRGEAHLRFEHDTDT